MRVAQTEEGGGERTSPSERTSQSRGGGVGNEHAGDLRAQLRDKNRKLQTVALALRALEANSMRGQRASAHGHILAAYSDKCAGEEQVLEQISREVCSVSRRLQAQSDLQLRATSTIVRAVDTLRALLETRMDERWEEINNGGRGGGGLAGAGEEWWDATPQLMIGSRGRVHYQQTVRAGGGERGGGVVHKGVHCGQTVRGEGGGGARSVEEEEEEEEKTLAGVATAARDSDPAVLMRMLASVTETSTARITASSTRCASRVGDSSEGTHGTDPMEDKDSGAGDSTHDGDNTRGDGSDHGGDAVEEEENVDIAAVVRECIALEHEAHARESAETMAVRAAGASLRAQTAGTQARASGTEALPYT
jgi:hypothetical protein